MQTRLPRVPWWRPAALAAVAVPSIFFLTQDRDSDAALVAESRMSRAEARPTVEERAAQLEIVRGLLSAGLENTHIADVRCRATLCRIEASHGSIEAERKFIARIGELEAFRNGEGFVERVPRSDGSIATMVFVSRSGHRLPSLPDVATFPFM